ncbi:MAG: outer membrane protein transport protein [Cycloclasticus sp.]
MDPPPYPTSVDSDSENFFIPSIGMSWSLSSDASIGLAIYGNGGMSTDYASHNTPLGIGTFGGDALNDGHTGVNYAQIFTNLSYSRKFADGKASWGVGAIFNYSYLQMEGLSGFFMSSEDPSNLSDQGYDHAFGVGLRLGVLGEVMPGLRLAASYQTKIRNTFDDYKGLFTNGGELDIPATAQIGLAADVGPGVLTLDIQHIYYSDADAIGNTSTSLLTGALLGDSVGFGWDDMTIFKAGYTWEGRDDWTWRLGASYGDQPIPDKEVTFNIIAPATIEQHYTAGFSKTLDSGKEINVAFMYAPEKCVSGNALFVPARSVELCMDQYSIDVGMSF